MSASSTLGRSVVRPLESPLAAASETDSKFVSREDGVGVGRHDPHGEELGPAAVGVAERPWRRRPGARRPVPRTCMAASAKRSMPEAPMGFDDSTPPDMFTGRSPSSSVAPSSVSFQPSPLGRSRGSRATSARTSENGTYISTQSISAQRVGDAGLRVDVGRRSRAALRRHRVAPGERARLGAHGVGRDPRRRLRRRPSPTSSLPSTMAQAPSDDGQVSR